MYFSKRTECLLQDGSTLMHIAALNGHPETAHMLFKKGVPLLMPNKVKTLLLNEI